ncbi:phosphoinositide 3-kinase regulatory subunit 6 [Ambystoma mexicanum]|uniref:phosphoinositide 3-kinase regulatory subunit 6 n=1 Tax=Ambystoma mexicanum TaxID=8296 RepID=UPI0037E881F2
MDCTDVESDIYRKVQAILREVDGQNPVVQCDRGMLRWTLHKNIDRNPNSACILVQVLVKELEKAERGDHKHHIVPLLHTLMYAVVKAPYISDDLSERVYTFCKKLLTLPKPYCAIGLDYAKQMKRERKTPGLLYQRMVIAEQSLKNDSYQHQEKVFVFLDQDLISESICNALLHETQAAQMDQNPRACMSYVITHTMQAALGQHCHAQDLQTALQEQPADVLEQCFQEVVAAVECTEGESSAERSRHAERLANIYSNIIRPSAQGAALSAGLWNVPLPNPRISFHLWERDDQLCKELVAFSKSQSNITEEVVSDRVACDPNRASVLSDDSGIEKDLPVCDEKAPPGLQRRPCIKRNAPVLDSMAFIHTISKVPLGKYSGTLHRMSGEATESTSNLHKQHTARVVILGDDRALGRMAKEYYALRKLESKPFGTIKANLQFYYIPILDQQPASAANKGNTTAGKAELCELAQYLGRIDPWYETNINPLCDMIPKLANMPSSPSPRLAADPFITDVTAYYLRAGRQPVFFQIYTVKIYFSDITQSPAEDIFLTELKADVHDSSLLKGNSMTKKKTMGEAPAVDVTIQYKKGLLSNREKEVTLSLRSSGMALKAIPSNEAEDLVCLNVNIIEVIKTTNLAGRSFSCDTTTVRTSNIKVQSLSRIAFTLCMDKDSRRMYSNVERFEVSPCLEPIYALQRMKGVRLSGSEKEDMGLAKYMSKSLMLPINTFAAIM